MRQPHSSVFPISAHAEEHDPPSGFLASYPGPGSAPATQELPADVADEMSDQRRMRASDRDRQQVVEQLRRALEDGRLTMEEYMERMEVAYQAATYGDLAPLCADLPISSQAIAGPQTIVAAAAPPAVFCRAGFLAGLPTVLKVLWTIWLAAVSITVVVWALVSGTGGHLTYPWPVWVAGPYGATLFAVSAGVTLFRRNRTPVAGPLVLTARADAAVARGLLGAAEDPLREAKDVLSRPGPLSSNLRG
jgi:hypothetical protein